MKTFKHPKNSKIHLTFVFLFVLSALSCSKDKDSTNPGTPNSELTGTIYYAWANEGVHRINLTDYTQSLVLDNSNSRHSWDISRDESLIIISDDAPTSDPNWYEDNQITLMNLDDGTIFSQFLYTATSAHAFLSFDNSMIAIPPDYDGDPITILNNQGVLLEEFTTYQAQEFEHNTQVVWMPDNSFLFTIGNNIYRTNSSHTAASLVKTLNFNNWGNLAVSPDGSKIAFNAHHHIWMMDNDGSNMKQVTISNDEEIHPVFSPDGKYLLIGIEYFHAGFSHWWRLAIIPADGNTYRVDRNNPDDKVIFIKKENSDEIQPASGYMYWR